MAATVAVLQATTSALAPCDSRKSVTASARSTTYFGLVAIRRVAGVGEVDQIFVRHCARMWRSTDSPPTPESNTPMGAGRAGHGIRQSRQVR
jgi:hypothetical protein